MRKKRVSSKVVTFIIILFNCGPLATHSQSLKSDNFFEQLFWSMPNSAEYQKVYNKFQLTNYYWDSETLSTDFEGRHLSIEFKANKEFTFKTTGLTSVCTPTFIVDFKNDKSTSKRLIFCIDDESQFNEHEWNEP